MPGVLCISGSNIAGPMDRTTGDFGNWNFLGYTHTKKTLLFVLCVIVYI
jgi:hypothetical protein